MGAVQGNGRPGSESEATGPGSGHQEGAEHPPGGQDAAGNGSPAPDSPHPGAADAGGPAGEPAASGPSGTAAAPDGAAQAPAAPPPEYAPPHPPGAAVPPPWQWEYPTGAGVPPYGAAPGPYPPGPYQSAPYGTYQQYHYQPGPHQPASYAPGPYPPGSYHPNQQDHDQSGPYQPASYAPGPYPPGSYPPGPYPPAQPGAGPYPAAYAPAAPPRRRPSWAAPSPNRTHRWGLGAYLVAEAVFLLVGVLIGIFLAGDGPPATGVLLVSLAAPTLLAAGTALLITRWRGNGPRIDLGLVWSWRDVGLGLAFGFGGLALTIPASIIYVAIVGQDASSAVGDVFGGIRAGPVLAALVLVIVVLVAPMCEEILYRGLLWGGIEKLSGRWVAFVVSTLLFALAHFEFTRTPLLFVVAIPIAIARLYTGRLLASIVAHQINNLLPGIVLVLGLLGVVPMA